MALTIRPPPPLHGEAPAAAVEEDGGHRRTRTSAPDSASVDLRAGLLVHRGVHRDRAEQLPGPVGFLRDPNRCTREVPQQPVEGEVPIGWSGPRRKRGVPGFFSRRGIRDHRFDHRHRGSSPGVIARFVQGGTLGGCGRLREALHGGA